MPRSRARTAALPTPLLDVLVGSGLAASKGAARRLIKGGGVRIGTTKITDVSATLDAEGVVWAGKKRCVRVLAG